MTKNNNLSTKEASMTHRHASTYQEQFPHEYQLHKSYHPQQYLPPHCGVVDYNITLHKSQHPTSEIVELTGEQKPNQDEYCCHCCTIL